MTILEDSLGKSDLGMSNTYGAHDMIAWMRTLGFLLRAAGWAGWASGWQAAWLDGLIGWLADWLGWLVG